MNEAAGQIAAVLGETAFTGDAHALLMAIYKNESLPLKLRLDAAVAAIGYEKPRLSSIDANIEGAFRPYEAQPIPVEERDSDALMVNGSTARN